MLCEYFIVPQTIKRDEITFFLKLIAWLCLFYTQTYMFSFAQVHKQVIIEELRGKTINFSTLLGEMAKKRPIGEKEYIVLRNITVRFDSIDREFMDKRFANGGTPIIIHHDLIMSEIDFDPAFWFVIRGLQFKGFFQISNCTQVKVCFKECIFEKTFRIYKNDTDFMTFESCLFSLGFMYENSKINEKIEFNKCSFTMRLDLTEDYRFSVFNRFVIDCKLFDISNKNNSFDLIINDCVFGDKKTKEQ